MIKFSLRRRLGKRSSAIVEVICRMMEKAVACSLRRAPPMFHLMKRAPFTVRAGSDADWAALGQAVADLQDFEHDLVGYPLKPGCEVWQDYLADLQRRLHAEDGVFLVAEANGNIVGVLAGYVGRAGDRLVDAAFDRSAYVSDLFVQGEWRRQGIGASLMRAFEQTMRAKGLCWMSVCVKSRNVTARQAYRKYGFEDYEAILTKRLA